MAAEPDDVFLRHRGAVLEALLSDTTLDAPTPPAPDPAALPAPDLDGPSAGPDPHAATPRQPSKDPAERNHAGELISALLAGRTEQTPAPAFTPAALPRAASNSARESEQESETGEPAPPRRGEHNSRLDAARARTRTLLTSRRARPLLLIAAAITLAILIAWIAGPDPQPRSDPLATKSATAAPMPTTSPPTTAPPAQGSQIHIRAAESKCPPGSTPGIDAFEGTPGKAWSCQRAFRLDGQVLRIDLGGTYDVASIAIVPGWDHIAADGTDQWTRYRTASRVSYRFNDPAATTYTQETLDQRTQVVTMFDPPVRASRIFLTILKSSGEPSINTTAISSIVITGT
ncbi:discoidin domain-containing protein [Nocardia sp. 2]|uniref:Discoidin domain-containing protein n=1 Tax=Nocardia acididurans TaxID=2802282 RepID=A0ABS1MIA9_9NOCA|nr:discoidin domain-containing protein [Nocardia acididurans]MBL1079785.1 discoidin domain-containing protein [Nocardia acididurans]